jgi:hypothetical protein
VPDATLPTEEIRVRIIRRMSDAIERNLIDLPTIDLLLAEAFLTSEALADIPAGESALLSVSS